MAILSIVCYDDDILREVSEPVDDPGRHERLARDMGETMLAAEGLGLAAPQVGQNVRLIVIHPRLAPDLATSDCDGTEGPAPIVLFNPEYEPMGGVYTDREGCLSLPDIFGRVARYGKLKLRALGIGGERVNLELEGFASRVIQHEVDHLDGMLIVDRLGRAQRMLLHRKLRVLDARTKRGWRRTVPDDLGT